MIVTGRETFDGGATVKHHLECEWPGCGETLAITTPATRRLGAPYQACPRCRRKARKTEGEANG